MGCWAAVGEGMEWAGWAVEEKKKESFGPGEERKGFELIQNRISNQIPMGLQNNSKNYRKIHINQFGHEEFK